MFGSDYHRRVLNCFWLWCFPAFDALPVAPALPVALPFARRRLPICLLGFPARPPPRRLPAARAAIPLTCLPGMNALLASFQQTTTHPRQTRQSPPPSLLIFGMVCRTLGRAHGR